MSQGSESAIVRLKSGGVEELTKIFEANRDALRAMVSRRIRGKLSARFDESDIIQESFIRAKKQLNNYLKTAKIHPNIWLRLLCKQILAESIRKNMRLRRSPDLETHLAGDQMIVERIADSLHSVGEMLAREEVISRVRTILMTLTETDQEIIEMRHSDAMTFPKIAAMLDINMEAAKKRYYRALEKFRDAFANEHERDF